MSQVESPPTRSQPETCRKTGRKGPVFALGLSKTGTTSLHKALIGLGYKSCHWQSNEFSEETRQLIESGAPLPFDAYTNVASVVQHYEQLDRRFPSAGSGGRRLLRLLVWGWFRSIRWMGGGGRRVRRLRLPPRPGRGR